jgi:hypothetical protein
MDRVHVFAQVLEAFRVLQEGAGHEPQKVTGDMRPIGDLTAFDSHAGLEFTCEVQQRLKMEIPLNENLCVNDEKVRARSVDEIVDRIIELDKGS